MNAEPVSGPGGRVNMLMQRIRVSAAQPPRAWVCDAKLVDLGADGLRLITAQLLDAETLVVVRLPQPDGDTAPLTVCGMVYAARRSAGGWRADVRFAASDNQARQTLRRFIAAVRAGRTRTPATVS